MDELKEYGVTAADILNANHTGEFRAPDALPGRTRQALLRRGAGALPPEDRHAQRPA